MNTNPPQSSAPTRPGTIKLFRADATWASTNPVSIPLIRPLTVNSTLTSTAESKDTYESVLIDAPTPLGRVLVHAYARPRAGVGAGAGSTRADSSSSVDDATFVLRSAEGGHLGGQLNLTQLKELYANVVCEGREMLGSRACAGAEGVKAGSVVLYEIEAIGEEDVPPTEDGETMTYDVEGQRSQMVRFVRVYTKVAE